MQLKNKKVLVVWPEEEYVMSVHTKIAKRWAYFGEIITYLGKNVNNQIKVLDCLNPKFSNGEVLKEVATHEYGCVIMVARFESIHALTRLSKWIKDIDSSLKILIYGDLCNYVPNFIKKEANIDAILCNGDWEIGITDYLEYIYGDRKAEDVGGVEMLINGKWQLFKQGKILQEASWELSDLDNGLLSTELYLALAKNELTISVSRGCPFNCKFCAAVSTFGSKDRRKKVGEVVKYIEKNKNRVTSFKLFSPTLTHDKEWVKEFCRELIKTNNIVKWCGTTRPDRLDDEEMVELMSQSGCYKIAMGVETLDEESMGSLKKHGVEHFRQVEDAIKLLRKYDIEAKALLMIGIKGQTAKNIKYSYSKLEEWGAVLRTAAYSPREMLVNLDKENKVTYEYIRKFDKMTHQDCDIDGLDRSGFLNLIYNVNRYKEIIH